MLFPVILRYQKSFSYQNKKPNLIQHRDFRLPCLKSDLAHGLRIDRVQERLYFVLCLLVLPPSQLTAEFGFFRAIEYRVEDLQKETCFIVAFVTYTGCTFLVAVKSPLSRQTSSCWLVCAFSETSIEGFYASLFWGMDTISADFLQFFLISGLPGYIIGSALPP